MKAGLSGTFDFTEGFQEKILAVLWRESESFAVYQECIKPKYFTKAVHVDLCRIILDYYSEYNSSPTLEVLYEEVNQLMLKYSQKAKLEVDFLKAIRNMSKMDLVDLDYVRNKIVDFGKRQAMVEAVIESADIIEKDGEYAKVETLIKEALRVGEDISEIGLVYFDEVEERILSYQNTEDVIERIPTGKQLLDMKMKGGLGRTEMGVVVAPPGRGKTTWLIDVASEALLSGYNVFHYSFENNEKQILRNYDTRIVGKEIEFITDNPDKTIECILNNQKYKAKQGQLLIKKYPTKTATVTSIKAHIKQIEVVMGIKPDMIIIDYGAIVKPSINYGDKRDRIESTYEEIRALADETNCAIWTGAQGNRSSLSKKIVTMEDLAECFAIANIADFMIALCQTKKEKVQKRMRYFIAKNRDSEDYQMYEGQDLRAIRKFTFDEEVRYTDDEEDDEEDQEDEKPVGKNRFRKNGNFADEEKKVKGNWEEGD